ncbi:hypothetical protein [Achromobacter animicus]|uniref:hypothetical protein n=1 Tax=Achromobacter animicus TaxID=1389935 RepID=UPI0028A80B1C|nr:hypothetical protein [Achromobacter animicus]
MNVHSPILRRARWILAGVVVVGGGWIGRSIPFAEQWPLFEALRTTAAIVFAVVGAWVAIMFPERLKQPIVKRADGTRIAGREGIDDFFTPVVHSTIILSIVLIVGVVAPIAKRFEWMILHSELWRGVTYALLIGLTLCQVWTVLMSLGQADEVKQTSFTHISKFARIVNRKAQGSTSAAKED